MDGDTAPIRVRLGFLLASDGLRRAFARASIRMGALTMNGQAATMTQAAIATEIHQPLNVHRNFTPQIALNRELSVNGFADLQNLAVGELIDAPVSRDFDALADLLSEFRANAMDVLERNDSALLGRNVNACDTGHSVSPNA